MAQRPMLLYKKLLPAIYWLTPKQMHDVANDVKKVEIFFTTSFIALIVMLSHGIIYNALDDTIAAQLCWFAAFVVFSNFLLFRISANLGLVNNVLIISIFSFLLAVTYRLGGISSPTVIWFAVCPAAVIGIGGHKQGLLWSGIVLFAILGIYLSDIQGYFPKPVLSNVRFLSVISTISLLLTITVVIMIFDQISTRALLRLDAAMENIRQEKVKAQVTLQSIGDAVITTDAEMFIDYLNPIAEKLTGWTTKEAKGLHMDTVFKIFNEQSGLAAVSPIKECLEKNDIVGMENHTILIRRNDNKEFHIEDSAAPIRRSDGSILGAVMVFHDVTDRKISQNRLHHIAHHDTLTGLPNRALFSKTLLTAIKNAHSLGNLVAVLFLDLDRFKTINDSLGHGVGDELLIAVAKRLRQCIRQSDIVCRMGGDEFTAVISNIESSGSAAGIANHIVESISQPFYIQGHILRISTSIGITIYPDDGKDLKSLLKNADAAMYFAKENGKGNYKYYNASMGEKADNNWQTETALHVALENCEFFLEYQPKLDLAKNTIVGSEALLRWQSPEFGRVMPSEFIPKLEESGAIVQVGNWVFKTAISQGKRWLDLGYPIVVSVNVSVRQFKQENLVAQIDELLKTTGFPSHLLQIEITESLLMDDAERSEIIIRDLREIGVKISLDDFGTGFSSLSYLRRFSIDELKIDRSFVVDMELDETAQKIIKTVVDLGQALGMRVTAEGVETENQKVHLRNIGCDEIQGYIFSRPLLQNDFLKFITQSITCGGT